ncbi:MAG: hypothetical protein AMXMBFR64_17320 [Myxococcales bacterium]
MPIVPPPYNPADDPEVTGPQPVQPPRVFGRRPPLYSATGILLDPDPSPRVVQRGPAPEAPKISADSAYSMASIDALQPRAHPSPTHAQPPSAPLKIGASPRFSRAVEFLSHEDLLSVQVDVDTAGTTSPLAPVPGGLEFSVPTSVMNPGAEQWTLANPAKWPFKLVGLLTPVGCTACLVGPRHIVTSLHCISKTPSGVVFWPGMAPGAVVYPFTVKSWYAITIDKGTLTSPMGHWDLAVGVLDSEPGVGWAGTFNVTSNLLDFQSLKFTMLSYPAVLGTSPVLQKGSISYWDSKSLPNSKGGTYTGTRYKHWMDTTAQSSGSPLWLPNFPALGSSTKPHRPPSIPDKDIPSMYWPASSFLGPVIGAVHSGEHSIVPVFGAIKKFNSAVGGTALTSLVATVRKSIP